MLKFCRSNSPLSYTSLTTLSWKTKAHSLIAKHLGTPKAWFSYAVDLSVPGIDRQLGCEVELSSTSQGSRRLLAVKIFYVNIICGDLRCYVATKSQVGRGHMRTRLKSNKSHTACPFINHSSFKLCAC